MDTHTHIYIYIVRTHKCILYSLQYYMYLFHIGYSRWLYYEYKSHLWVGCPNFCTPVVHIFMVSQLRFTYPIYCITFHCASTFNTLRPRQIGRHFADGIFKCIFFNENVWILIRISLKFVPALVQIMAWRRPGDKPLSEPMMVSLPTHICVIRPQWVDSPVVKCLMRFSNDKSWNKLFQSELQIKKII